MKRILLIEDDELMRGMVRQMLELEDFEVIEAADGNEGLAAYRKHPTDLVITDIIMPHKDGLNTIDDLLREFPRARIIAISGGGSIKPERYLSVAKILGANRILEKPFSRKQLLEAIWQTQDGIVS